MPAEHDSERPERLDPERREAPHSPASPPHGREGRDGREDDDEQGGEREGRKGLFERAIPEVVKRVVERAVERGVDRLAEGPEQLRALVGDKLPKEALQYLYAQVDETKNGLYRVVAKEIRDVLEQTQFAEELTKVLTKLSFEIKTEIRFIPNEKATGTRAEGEGGGLPKPEVKAEVNIRDRGNERSKDRSSVRPPRREDE